MDLLVIMVLALAAAGAWRWLRGGGTATPEERLVGICLGDRTQAGHLIEAELTRAPGISRTEAACRAVLRYERDNR